MKIILGNEMEFLFEGYRKDLVEDLFSGIKERLLVPSSPGLGEWMEEALLASPELGFTFGLKIISPQKALFQLLGQKKIAPNPESLALYIYSHLHEEQSGTYEEAKRYGRYFHYISGLFKEDLNEQLETMSPKGRRLFEKTFGPSSPFMPLYVALNGIENLEFRNCRVDFFGLPLFTPLQWEILRKLQNKMSLHFWLFSPSMHFWEDHYLLADEFMMEGPPLLASWGSAARKVGCILNQEAIEMEEWYRHTISCQPFFEEYTLPETHFRKGVGSLLEKLQGEHLFFSSVDKKADDSIQFHESSTPYRTIEIVYDLILDTIHKKGLVPSDFIILTPQLDRYREAIQAIFGKTGSHLGFHIAEGEETEEKEVEEKISLFLRIIAGNWEKKTVFSFLKRDEEWLSGYSFGPDFISWERTLKSLLLESLEGNEEIPFEKEGALYQLLSQLRAINNSCNKARGNKMLSEWIRFLVEESVQFLEDLRFLDDLLERLHRKCAFLEIAIDLSFFKELLEETIAEKRRSNVPKRELGTPLFSTFRAHGLVPAKAIIALASDHFFPAVDSLLWVDEKKVKSSFYMRGEEDRLLFLEALHSARDLFCLIYETHPSQLLEELMTHLGDPSIYIHPEMRIDPRGFEKESPFRVYSKNHFDAAAALYGQIKACIREENRSRPIPKTNYYLRDIAGLVRNPLAHFLKENYKLIISESEKTEEDPFNLSPKEIFELRRLRTHLSESEWDKAIAHRLRFKELPAKPFWELLLDDIKMNAQNKSEEGEEVEISISVLGDIKKVVSVGGMNPLEVRVPQTNRLANRIKNSPLYLFQWCKTGIKPKWLFIDGTSFEAADDLDPTQLMASLLQFYEEARQKPVALLADWVDPDENREQPLFDYIEKRLSVSRIDAFEKAKSLYGWLYE